MRSFKRSLIIGMMTFALGAASAESYALPVCLDAGYPAVLEIGQAGAPGNPIVIGGYLVAYNGTEYQKIPLVGNLSFGADGSVDIGFTSHFDWGSGNWYCPVGDTVIKANESGATWDTTYHGGEPDDVDANCPNNFTGNVSFYSCEGLSPFDPNPLQAPTAAGPNTR